MSFYGRTDALVSLGRAVDDVAATGRGQLLAVRGRRQVGKSRLLTHFVENSGLPYLYFSAVKNATSAQQLTTLAADARTATKPLDDAEALLAGPARSWVEAFSRIALACRSTPSVIVLDEFPWAVESDATLEGTLQNAWDHQLEGVPVLFVLVGSDVAMMQRITEHDRPLFGRSRVMIINPFSPGECAEALGGDREPLDVFDNYLITGGYPRLVARAARAEDALTFAEEQLGDETSELVVMAQLSLDAEFPPDAQPRRVLSTIGGFEVGVVAFSQVVGGLGGEGSTAETAASRSLKILVDAKRVVSMDHPVGTKSSTKLRRYRISDPYLRFWFRFVELQLANLARGRPDIARAALRRGWSSWRGKAIEPVVHEALFRLAPDIPELADVVKVGSWWNRINNPEVDIVAARDVDGRRVAAVGSVKWREKAPFSGADAAALRASRSSIPGAEDAALIAVCPAGVKPDAAIDLHLSAAQLLAAWGKPR
jgi:AAA+ ATPase superfamily predicted ATPase